MRRITIPQGERTYDLGNRTTVTKANPPFKKSRGSKVTKRKGAKKKPTTGAKRNGSGPSTVDDHRLSEVRGCKTRSRKRSGSADCLPAERKRKFRPKVGKYLTQQPPKKKALCPEGG